MGKTTPMMMLSKSPNETNTSVAQFAQVEASNKSSDNANQRMAPGEVMMPDRIFDVLNPRLMGIAIEGGFLSSKPNPEVFTKCADELGVAYQDCIVFEDAPMGVEAAMNAGMKAVVITSYHKKEDFAQLPNVLMYISDYNDKNLDQLF